MLKILPMLISAAYGMVQYHLDLYDIAGDSKNYKLVFEKGKCKYELVVPKEKAGSEEVSNWLKARNSEKCRGQSEQK